jgi:peptide/nickel transport system ATP-binding protein
MSVICVEDLRVELEASGHPIVDEVSFSIAAGEVLGLVGESGSGKTTVATALLADARRGARISNGSVGIDGTDLLSLPQHDLRRIRGKVISYIPQDPSAALNPALRIGTQLRELLRVHNPGGNRSHDVALIEQALAEVKLEGSRALLRRYPHQLSGGQQQRICIAMAFLLRPRVIVLDEPTTGLDVSTQAHVLRTLRELCAAHEVAALYVSHDLAVVGQLATRVMVMYGGLAVEAGPADSVFERAAHPYTRDLLDAIPDVRTRRELRSIGGRAPLPGARPHGCVFAPRCGFATSVCETAQPSEERWAEDHVVRCYRANEIQARTYRGSSLSPQVLKVDGGAVLSVRDVSAGYSGRRVLNDVSLDLHPRECLALVGESGSGKTTLSRAIAGLLDEWNGSVRLEGELLPAGVRERTALARRRLQYVFQSPYTALNPRRSVAQTLETPVRQFFNPTRAEREARVVDALSSVALPEAVLRRYPYELSGGERQRVAIARALVCEPTVLICDEITSALDVSVQAAIVELLRELQAAEELAMLFVTHNLALVRTIADRVAVMKAGRIVEVGDTDALLDGPANPYTKSLLEDTPRLQARAAVAG